MVALGQWKRGREGGRQGKTDRDGGVRWSSGQSLTLQESIIASGSQYPPEFLSFLPPLSFHSSLHLSFFSAPLLISSHSLSLFWLLLQFVLLGGVAQGDNVCREAVFEQDTSVSLAVELSYETVPVDHKAWTKPAEPDKRNKGGPLWEHHSCHLGEFWGSYEWVTLLLFIPISAKCSRLLTLDEEGITKNSRNKQVKRQRDGTLERLIYER